MRLVQPEAICIVRMTFLKTLSNLRLASVLGTDIDGQYHGTAECTQSTNPDHAHVTELR